MRDPASLILYFQQASYLGIALTLAMTGIIIPIPEEIALVSVGYIAAIGFHSIWLIIFFSIIGILAGDCCVFFLSRHGSPLLQGLMRRINEDTVIRYQKHMEHYAFLTIFLLKFAVGLRLLGIVLAGSLHVKPSKFILAEVAALSIYTPLFILLGYHFHETISSLIPDVYAIRHGIAIAVFVAMTLGITYLIHKKYFRASRPQ